MSEKLHIDLGIIGGGLVSSLLLLALDRQFPQCRVAIIPEQREIAGTELLLVLPERISPSLADLIEPALVRQWDGYQTWSSNGNVYRAERVCLLDPMQIWLEIQETVQSALIVPRWNIFGEADLSAGFDGLDLYPDDIIDFRAQPPKRQRHETVSENFLCNLKYPVLADLMLSGRSFDYLQYIPFGQNSAIIKWIDEEKYRFSYHIYSLKCDSPEERSSPIKEYVIDFLSKFRLYANDIIDRFEFY